MVATAGLPREIVDQLAAQIVKLLADPATRDKLTALALEPIPAPSRNDKDHAADDAPYTKDDRCPDIDRPGAAVFYGSGLFL